MGEQLFKNLKNSIPAGLHFHKETPSSAAADIGRRWKSISWFAME